MFRWGSRASRCRQRCEEKMKVASKILCSVWAITLAVMLNLALSVGASGISIPPTVYCEQMPVSLAYDGASSPTCDYDSAYTYADEKENRSEKIGGVCAHFTEFLAAKKSLMDQMSTDKAAKYRKYWEKHAPEASKPYDMYPLATQKTGD